MWRKKRKKREEKCSLETSASGDDGPKKKKDLGSRDLFTIYSANGEKSSS